MDHFKKYIGEFLTVDNPILTGILQENMGRKDVEPAIGLEVSKVVGLLIHLSQAKRVLEFGTCLGFSTIALATALRGTGGKLISVEYDEKLHQETKANVEKAGLSDMVELIHGDANTVIDKLAGPFDLILQDSDKRLYPVMLEKCINLTRKHGLILADDTLFRPMGIIKELSDPIHEYNELIFRDERLYSTILPIGDGLAISVKLTD